MKWFIKCLKQYADFNGRARRKEYWWFTLINTIIFTILMIGWMTPITRYAINSEGDFDEWELFRTMFSNPFIYIYFIYYLAVLIPTLAVTVRRLHDIGRSGFWIFLYIGASLLGMLYRGLYGMDVTSVSVATMVIGLISVAIGILFLVWMFTDSDYCPNKWGPNPKETTDQPEN